MNLKKHYPTERKFFSLMKHEIPGRSEIDGKFNVFIFKFMFEVHLNFKFKLHSIVF